MRRRSAPRGAFDRPGAPDTALRWVYLFPAVAFTVAFFVVPLVFIAVVSPMRWDGIGAFEFVGLHNFVRLCTNHVFQVSIENTLLWIAVGLFVHIPLALLVALALSRKLALWRVFRAVFFLPSIVSTTALALLWYFVFNPEFGILDAVLKAVGLTGLAQISWLANPHTALWASQVPYVVYIGFPMMVILTQIATIPDDYFEAARIDGARGWEVDLYVTIPLVKPALLTNALFVTTYCLRLFEYPFVMTDGGPANATMNLSLFVYKAMNQSYDYGGAMAASAATVGVGAIVIAALFLAARVTPGNR
jgi:raffinose/stachyose/melibiose transport system permease protein